MRRGRRYVRTNIQSIARITAIMGESVAGPFEGLIWSIGFGGLGVRARQAVEVGSRVETVLSLVDLNGKVCRETVHGRVVWDADQSPYFMFGIQFVSINSNDHPGLMSFLDAQKKEFERYNLQNENIHSAITR